MTLNDAIHPAIPYPTSFHVDSVNGVPLLSTLHMTSDIIAIPTYSPSDALALVAQLAFTMGAAGAYRSCDSLKACRSFCRGAAASTVNQPAAHSAMTVLGRRAVATAQYTLTTMLTTGDRKIRGVTR